VPDAQNAEGGCPLSTAYRIAVDSIRIPQLHLDMASRVHCSADCWVQMLG